MTAFLMAIILWYAFFYTNSKDALVNAGSANNELILSGEYWRCITALFLHADLGHILANAICIYIFGAALIRHIGPGFSCLMILLGGGLGNLTTAGFYHDELHNAIGASTAVFATLASVGVIRAYQRFFQSPARTWRIKPIIAIICIFSMIGVSTSWTTDMRPYWDGNIDYMAHFLGFLWGGILALSFPLIQRWKSKFTMQFLALMISMALPAAAWYLAINS